jgi:hypothetical protein
LNSWDYINLKGKYVQKQTNRIKIRNITYLLEHKNGPMADKYIINMKWIPNIDFKSAFKQTMNQHTT